MNLFRNRERWQWKLLIFLLSFSGAANAELHVGFSDVDVTPTVDREHIVWLAGYGWNRRATGIHDPLYARCVVLSDGTKKSAFVSVDVVGLQYPTVRRVREALKRFDYVMVASTHNHEGPDTIGIWGPNPFRRGVDEEYMDSLVDKIVNAVNRADELLQPATAAYGTATDETLLGDSRLPIVKDGTMRLLRFENGGKTVGLLVQWNCHPEALGSKNTLVTADFPYATIQRLEKHFRCPVAYFSGAVGGLMAPPDGRFRDDRGRVLKEGEFAYAEAYGRAVADLAIQAAEAAEPIDIVPFRMSVLPIAMPVVNPLYRAASLAGVVKRDRVKWTGDFDVTDAPIKPGTTADELSVLTEVGFLRFGSLSIACLPGEIYPELVYGRFQQPPDPNADFPEAPLEPHVTALLPDERWLLFGLANDEIGYIIPKRQWDQQPPYAYGRTRSQYGEINSCGPDVAPIIMEALKRRIHEVAKPPQR